MRPTVTFTKGATSVTVPAPARLVRNAVSRAQAKGRTAGGETFAYDLGSEVHDAELEFRSLTSAEKDSLAAFFKGTALGMRETWTYTDPAGGARTARFAEPALVFVQFARNVWDCSMRLELDGLIAD
ncbi:MAG: hypothetical protein ACYTKD_18660 [Planctomycetota bacterium]